jgi:hypothetical protein
MKTVLVVLVSVVLAVMLIGAGVFAGMAWSRSRSLGAGCAGDSMMGERWGGMFSGGRSMLGRTLQERPCATDYTTSGQGEITTLDDAKAAVERYVQEQGYTGLEVKEVMVFERNTYAIVSEKDTGIGAMELLINGDTGAVGPEPGPNMMWNAKYGMMAGSGMGRGGMMGRGAVAQSTGEMTLSATDAEDVAQRWLDANLPGRTAGEADPFYGYYTLHFLKDGEVDGMLSVHGSTGDVWYHSWHGAFIEMTEEAH